MERSARSAGSRRRIAVVWAAAVAAAVLAAPAPPAGAATTYARASVTSAGQQLTGEFGGNRLPSITADGRSLAFLSDSETFGYVPGGRPVVLVRDRQFAQTEAPFHEPLTAVRLSANGQYAAVKRGSLREPLLFVRDRGGAHVWGLTDLPGTPLCGEGAALSISSDARYLAVNGQDQGCSFSTPADTTDVGDVYVIDRVGSAAALASVAADGTTLGNGDSWAPAISGDGKWLAFLSDADNLVAGDTNSATDTYLKNLQTGALTRLGRVPSDRLGTYLENKAVPMLSADGKITVFETDEALDPADTNGVGDVYAYDRTTGTSQWVSNELPGVLNDHDRKAPAISGDGRVVTWTGVTDFVDDFDFTSPLFRTDRVTGVTTELWSQVDFEEDDFARPAIAALSNDGCDIGFTSYDAVVAGDTNDIRDVFVASLGAGCNPTTVPDMSASGFSVAEGNLGAPTHDFVVSLSAPATATVTVDYDTSDGSAEAGSDYGTASGSLTFAPGETSKTVPVAIAGDILDEDNETFTLELSNESGATLTTPSAVGTILDDDASPSVSISGATVVEGATGTTTPVQLAVTLSAASGRAVSVDYGTGNAGASAGTDYQAASGTVAFAAGETAKTVTVNVTGDAADEPDESFTVALSNPANATIGTSPATVTITDDDPPPVGGNDFVSVFGTSATTASGPAGAGDPLGTTVASPNAGQITITESAGPGGSSAWASGTWSAAITAPPATAANPLRFTFELHPSAFTPPPSAVDVFRNGVVVQPCAVPAPAANPDPCVESRVVAPTGNLIITVRTSAASTWTFGTPITDRGIVAAALRTAEGGTAVIAAASDGRRVAGALSYRKGSTNVTCTKFVALALPAGVAHMACTTADRRSVVIRIDDARHGGHDQFRLWLNGVELTASGQTVAGDAIILRG